jgi:hypothetical protein
MCLRPDWTLSQSDRFSPFLGQLNARRALVTEAA